MGTIYRKAAKQKLAILWGLCSSILIVVMVILTFGGEDTINNQEYWSWFLPHIVPGISLIMSVIVVEANNPPKNVRMDKFYFHCAFAFSCFHFLLLALFIGIDVFPSSWCIVEVEPDPCEAKAIEPLQFEVFNLVAGTLSGFVIAALGMFFIKKEN